MKKIIAVLLASVLLVFTGCSDETSFLDPYGYTASQGKVTEAKLDDLTYVMQIDGYGVTKQYFSDIIMAAAQQYTQGYIDILTDGSDESKEFYDIIKEYAETVILQEAAFKQMAIDNNIALTAEDETVIETNLNTYIEQSGGQDAFDQLTEQSGISNEFYNNQLFISELSGNIYEYYTNPESGYTLSNDELKAIAEESYVMVKHVLVDESLLETAVDSEGNAYEELIDLANDITKRAQDGEDFDSLIEQYNIDPGMESNPDGYFFTTGVMVPEFEEESFAMEVGDISDPVKTDYGYHIIQKVAITDEVLEANVETLSSEYSVGVIEDEVTKYVEALDVVYSSQYDSLTLDILFPDLFGIVS